MPAEERKGVGRRYVSRTADSPGRVSPMIRASTSIEAARRNSGHALPAAGVHTTHLDRVDPGDAASGRLEHGTWQVGPCPAGTRGCLNLLPQEG